MKQKIFNNWYPYQVWLMSLLIGPVLWMIFISIKAGGSEPITDMIVMLFASFLIGMFFSLPVLLFYVSAYHVLRSSIAKAKRLKLTLGLLASLGIWITFAVIFNNDLFSSESFVFPLAYTIGTLLAGFIFKVKVVQEPWEPLT